MNGTGEKLRVLTAIARRLNEKGVCWAVGASVLLYFKNKVSDFHDIDIMVCEEDIEKAKEALLPMGVLAPPSPNRQYRTRHFVELTVDGIEVDVIAGFVIVKDGTEYDCSFSRGQIAEYIRLDNERIPLQSLADWRRYYELMGRAEKVKLLEP